MAFSYGIPDGTYTGRPTTASCFEKDGRLILDVNFAVKDPQTGEWYKKDNGYEWEAKKRHWLSSKDGGFHEATIAGIREWAKGWNPTSFDDFYWFQLPDANGVPFGNLAAIGEVELNFQTDNQGNQQIWVHDPNRPKTGGGRKVFVPDGAQADKAALMAKWGTKAKALFAATPKKVATVAAPKAAQNAPHPSSDRIAAPAAPSGDMTAPAASAPAVGVSAPPAAPARPAAAPARPAANAPAAKPWANYPQDANGAFSFFCAKLEERGEKYASAKHDGRWFEIYDSIASNPRDPQDPGKDPDELTQQEVDNLFKAVDAAFAG